MRKGQARLWIVALFLLLLLAGCYLVSGQQIDQVPLAGEEEGRYAVEFVSADGVTEADLQIGLPDVPVRLLVSAEVEWGELALEFYDPDGSPVLTVESRYGRPGRGIEFTRSNEEGLVHYQVRAHEAKKGTYTIRYRIQEKPTPTPTPTSTAAPIPTAAP